MIEHLTVETFPTKVLACPDVAVIDVWAPWCRPCQALSPIFSQVAQRFAGQARFFKINADENPELIRKYRLTSIPTLLYFSRGKLIDRQTGWQSFEAITQGLIPLLTLSSDDLNRQATHSQCMWARGEFWG